MRLVFLGPPGAGKGTQASGVAEAGCIPHISTGDMLRAAVAAGTPVGLKAKAVMDAGDLVPDDVIIEIVADRLREDDAAKGFLLDGFPRTLAQAEALDKVLAEIGKLDAVIYFSCADETVVERIMGRAAKEGRQDDNPETVRSRLRVYDEQTAPLIDYYRQQGLLSEVSAEPTIDEVAADLKRALASVG
jgi:adenylate kinase